MRELPKEKLLVYAGAVILSLAVAPLVSRLPRSGGKKPLYHLIFLVAAVLTILFVPGWIQDEIFSPGGVLVVGTVLPIYESIVAVCSIGSQDDVAWLQYWIAAGSFSFLTEWMDAITDKLPQAGEHWYEFEFFVSLWLMFPLTDGSGLLYETITKPYFAPIAQRIKNKVEGWIQAILAVVNVSYLWMVWFFFMSLPEEQRRFLVVALGTVYPMAASTFAITTENDTKDEMFWLTYWSCYMILFMAMDYLENFVGHIRGFYSLCVVATLYLFLPMFRGAEVVFRNVLVPLSGQHENMLLHDTYMVRKNVEKSIPDDQKQRVLTKAADVFTTRQKVE